MLDTTQSLVFSRYKLDYRIATGAVGIVFSAVDERTGGEVVLKYFHVPNQDVSAWVAEMRLALRLKHPHIVRCLDMGYDDQRKMWVLVFEKALGGSLRRALVANRDFSRDDLTTFARQMLEALDYASAKNVVHRDLKPENIVAATDEGKPPWLLTDFGVGRRMDRDQRASSVVGTFAYMAPEVSDGRGGSYSDLFSLGIIMLEVLTGKLPTKSQRADFVLKHRGKAGIEGFIGKLCESNPYRRFPNFQSALQNLEQGFPVAEITPVTRRPDSAGSHERFILHGDYVCAFTESGESSRDVRVPRVKRFAHLPTGLEVLAASHRRLVQVDEGPHARVLYATDHPVTIIAGSLDPLRVWYLDDGKLHCYGGDLPGGTLSANLPDAVSAQLREEATIFLIDGDKSSISFGFIGYPGVVVAKSEGSILTMTELFMKLPLAGAETFNGQPIILAGNALTVETYRLTGSSIEPIVKFGVPADTLTVQMTEGVDEFYTYPSMPAQSLPTT